MEIDATSLPERLHAANAARWVSSRLDVPVSKTSLMRAPVPRRRVGRLLVYERADLIAYVRERLATPPALPIHHQSKTEGRAVRGQFAAASERGARMKKKS
jgi:hypothetical protein